MVLKEKFCRRPDRKAYDEIRLHVRIFAGPLRVARILSPVSSGGGSSKGTGGCHRRVPTTTSVLRLQRQKIDTLAKSVLPAYYVYANKGRQGIQKGHLAKIVENYLHAPRTRFNLFQIASRKKIEIYASTAELKVDSGKIKKRLGVKVNFDL